MLVKIGQEIWKTIDVKVKIGREMSNGWIVKVSLILIKFQEKEKFEVK